MKTFLKIIYWLLGLIAVLVIIAFILPKTYKVERIVYINADKDLIYNLTSKFTKWHLWVPWTKEMDSTAVFEIQGPDGQVGTIWKWKGKKMGEGTMTATELIPGQLVGYDLSFNQGKYQSKGKVTIEPGDSCKVSWTDEGDLGYNPMARYMGLFMEKMMGPDFEKGLAKLKRITEERKGWPKIEETRMPAQTVLLICDSAGPKTFEKIMGKAFGELMAYMKKIKVRQTGAPFAIYLKWDSVTYFSVMEIGIPVEKADKGSGRIMIRTIPEQNVIKSVYFGPYDKTGPTYNALIQYIKESNKEMIGGPWEVYVTNPMEVKDTMKWETDIVFPVK
jgi:effector-binding domain-containing protein